MSENFDGFTRLMRHPVKSRLFLFSKLPSAYFAGVRIKQLDRNTCSVTVPYKWFSQNPFRSTYFACLAMAAEMSTGALALGHLHERTPAVSMLVTGLEADFSKRATGLTTFTCEDGKRMQLAIEETVATGDGVQMKVTSVGKNEQGEIIATFRVTWSFKVKLKK